MAAASANPPIVAEILVFLFVEILAPPDHLYWTGTPTSVIAAGAFWNTVGAGLLGFTINPPASLYYFQGLNLTTDHGHAALFGVYGMLGNGLTLFCPRGLFSIRP